MNADPYAEFEFLPHAIRKNYVSGGILLVAKNENCDAGVIDHRFPVPRPLLSKSRHAWSCLREGAHYKVLVRYRLPSIVQVCERTVNHRAAYSNAEPCNNAILHRLDLVAEFVQKAFSLWTRPTAVLLGCAGNENRGAFVAGCNLLEKIRYVRVFI